MSFFFYWTGLVVWSAIGLVAFWLLVVEVAIGFANSISCMRWRLRNATSFNWRKHWRSVLWHVLKDSFTEFYGYRNVGNRTHTHSNGHVWMGIGDWTVEGDQIRRKRV